MSEEPIKSEQNTDEKKDKDRKWFGWEVIRQKLPIALLVFFTFLACMIVIFLFFRFSAVAAVAEVLIKALRPVLIGLVWGYLLNPIMVRIENLFLKLLLPGSKNYDKTKGFIRMISAIIAVLFSVVVIGLLVVMIIPAIISSATTFAENFYPNLDKLLAWFRSFDIIRDSVPKDAETTIVNASTAVMNWLNENVMTKLQEYAATVTGTVMGVTRAVVDFIVGLIVAIYVLNEKERFEGQAKKIVYSVFPTKVSNVIVEILHKSNEIFSGFIVGKIIDSFIIGVICFVVCSIVRMPYAVIVSVIVGVTNVIPFFGPFIGAIPSIILIMFTDPLYGIYFAIFILILQQVDGNIIGPKILGDSTGLSSFWVIAAILVGGSMWGFAGMLFGVPIFASLYYITRRAVDYFAKKRNLKKTSLEYTLVEKIDEESGEITYDEKRKENQEKLLALTGTKRHDKKPKDRH